MSQFLFKTEHITLCLFDVLGTSEMTKRKELGKIYSYYQELSQIVNHDGEPVFGKKLNVIVPVPNDDGTANVIRGFVRIYNAFFSDTFIIWTETHSLGVWIFNNICNEVFCKALELQIPIRGCISSGEAIMDVEKRLFIGEPLVEAARGEIAQRWLGLTYGNSFDDKLHWDLRHYIPYNKQIKEGFNENLLPFAIDWPRYWQSTRNKDAVSILKSMNDNEKFSCYYDTSVDFFKHSQSHSKWYEETKALYPSSRDEYFRDINNWLDTLM